MRTRQKRVATDTWRSLGCRTTPLEHWSRRKPTVEPRWAKQQTTKLRPKPTKINSFTSGPSLSPFTQRASDDAAMHAFFDAMKRSDRVFTLHAIKPLFPRCQIDIPVVKLETYPMRAITDAMDLARVVTRQCEYIIKIYRVLIFPLVALLHRSLTRSLCERTLRL